MLLLFNNALTFAQKHILIVSYNLFLTFCFLFDHDNVIAFIMMQPVYVNCSFAPLDGFALISTKGPAA